MSSDEKTLAERDYHGRFLPGVSGNRDGRPTVLKKVSSEIRTWIDEKGKAALIAIVENPAAKDKDRVDASRLLWAYAFGQPRQPLDLSAGSGDPEAPVSIEEVKRLYAALVLDNGKHE